MRNLFVSERRCIANIIETEWDGGICLPSQLVLAEYHSDPSDHEKRPRFNCDFTLDFVDKLVEWPENVTAAASVLPNALGAEIFLTIEEARVRLMRLDLIGGGAFPIKRYSAYIRGVEEALEEAIESFATMISKPSRNVLLMHIQIQESAYARILVIGNDATFLYFPRDSAPIMHGERVNLVRRDDREIDCYVDGDEIVCFDGWVRTDITRTERTLVAIPKRKKAI